MSALVNTLPMEPQEAAAARKKGLLARAARRVPLRKAFTGLQPVRGSVPHGSLTPQRQSRP